MKVPWLIALVMFVVICGTSTGILGAERNIFSQTGGQGNHPKDRQSRLYEVTLTESNFSRPLTVFQSTCPKYQPGNMNMRPVDQNPLDRFHGRSISWVSFPLSNAATIDVRWLGSERIESTASVKIYPSRLNVTAAIDGNTIRFTLTQPGQYSVELGDNGWQHGLVLFADPPETDQPNPATGNYCVLTNATPAQVNAVPPTYAGIYFASGVHDIGVYHVPAHIRNIYFPPGSWVYGALIFDGHPAANIFGRGVLSGAKLNYRQSHLIEAVNHSDQIDLEGIVVADTKFFSVRLLGTNNTVQWIKTIGGWTYNTDGIAAFAGSTVSHCFIWANDDSIKPYANNLRISDCVVWQLNNGAVIQLGWGNDKATNVTIRHIDVLHAEWNNDAANRGVVSCIGDKFAKGNLESWQRSYLIEDIVTETPVPFIFNIRPNPASPDQMQDMTFKNWNVKMNMSQGWSNRIEGGNPSEPLSGFVFDNVVLNGVKLTASNWTRAGRFVTKNLAPVTFH